MEHTGIFSGCLTSWAICIFSSLNLEYSSSVTTLPSVYSRLGSKALGRPFHYPIVNMSVSPHHYLLFLYPTLFLLLFYSFLKFICLSPPLEYRFCQSRTFFYFLLSPQCQEKCLTHSSHSIIVFTKKRKKEIVESYFFLSLPLLLLLLFLLSFESAFSVRMCGSSLLSFHKKMSCEQY